MDYISFKSRIFFVFTVILVCTGCQKDKQVEFTYPPFDSGSYQNITGTYWTSIDPSFVTNNRIMAMDVVDNKMLVTYVTGSSFYGQYDGEEISSSVQFFGNGSGFEKIQKINGTSYALGLIDIYGAWKYDLNAASSNSFSSEVASYTNIYAMAKFDGKTVVSCGASPSVRWNPNGSYIQMGAAFGAAVNDFAIYNDELIAAGEFNTIGGNTVKYIARWNGSTWEQLGSGLSGKIYDLEIYQGKLIAVGAFTQSGDGNTSCRYVAEWNGTTWAPLESGLTGGGINGALKAVTYGNQLFIGGDFGSAGGVMSPNIIKWNGTSWEGLAGGAPDIIGEICIYGGHLYVANHFNVPNSNFLLKLN